jgi:hypothetical protein
MLKGQPSAWTAPAANGKASKAMPKNLFMNQSSCDKEAQPETSRA